MSAADGFTAPPSGAAHGQLEQRYRRLLRLYPREFRAGRGAEMLGVLMASARGGQTRPVPGDVADIVRGSLLMRLRGPRGGWASALAAFALLAPLFLVLTDILQVAVPYPGSQASGTRFLGQPSFLILAGGHVIVAAAVLAGRRRTALAVLLAAAAVDLAHYVHLTGFNVLQPRLTMVLLTGSVLLVEAFALAVADPRAARRLVTWRHGVTVLLLAAAVQAWSFAAYSSADLPRSPWRAYLVTGFVLAVLGLALPLVLGLGWRISLLFAAVCYPCALGVGFIYTPHFSFPPTKLALYLPPLLVACWSAARTVRTGVTRRRGRAHGSAG